MSEKRYSKEYLLRFWLPVVPDFNDEDGVRLLPFRINDIPDGHLIDEGHVGREAAQVQQAVRVFAGHKVVTHDVEVGSVQNSIDDRLLRIQNAHGQVLGNQFGIHMH